MFVWKIKFLSFVSKTNKPACFPVDTTIGTEVIYLKDASFKKSCKSSNPGRGEGNGDIRNKLELFNIVVNLNLLLSGLGVWKRVVAS